MNKEYISLEKELAELLGWTDVRQVAANLVGQDGIDWRQVPVWCSDDAAVFQLMVEHSVDVINYEDTAVCTYIEGNAQGAYLDCGDFTSKAEALRVSIVNSIIMKLKVYK